MIIIFKMVKCVHVNVCMCVVCYSNLMNVIIFIGFNNYYNNYDITRYKNILSEKDSGMYIEFEGNSGEKGTVTFIVSSCFIGAFNFFL